MNIRFPSVKEISTQSVATFKRFPLVLATAIVGSLAAVWLIANEGEPSTDTFWYVANLCWVTFLGISVFFSVATFTESQGWGAKKTWGIKAAVLLAILVYYLLLPLEFTPEESEVFFRYLLFVLAAHLLVSFVPFINKQDPLDFWAYNKTLLLQFLRSALYSAALYIGLIIAMVSLDLLLEFEIDGERYFQLWVCIVGIFNTWLFLSGVPKAHDLTEKERAYPGGLKVFVQYILLPLITVYICILYLYTGKILLEWQWPNGWVANLVLTFSIAGILALLLLYPIRRESKNRWIQHFSRFYYIALIPLVILLMFSIWVRISEYGVTVNRYFVATLGVWLSGMVIYFIFRKEHNIKVIPISLFAVAILISFGPLGAFEVSKRSQLDRIELLLQKNDLLAEDGTIKQVSDADGLSFEDQKQISSSIKYVVTLKGAEALQSYFEEDLKTVVAHEDSVVGNTYETEQILGLVGLSYIPEWKQPGGIYMESKNMSYTIPDNQALPLSGFDYYLGEYTFSQNYLDLGAKSGAEKWKLSFDKDSLELTVSSEQLDSDVMLSMKPFMEEVVRRSKASAMDGSDGLIMQEQGNGSLRVKVILKQLHMVSSDEPELNWLRVAIFVASDQEN